MTQFADHDAYIAGAAKELRPLLVKLRKQLARTLPDAEEVIAYNMPGFRIGKSIIAGYAAFSKQCGLYVAPAAIKGLAGELAKAAEADEDGRDVLAGQADSGRARREAGAGVAEGSGGLRRPGAVSCSPLPPARLSP